uniref:Arf-GAP domain-containing protein n=1 Tax=Scophthalmus maximus TaxID=52904 RepID=A0A8D3DKA1_SCOMX
RPGMKNKTRIQTQDQVVMRLVENPCNKLCGDCGTANPEWASVNLLLVIFCPIFHQQHLVMEFLRETFWNANRVCSQVSIGHWAVACRKYAV